MCSALAHYNVTLYMLALRRVSVQLKNRDDGDDDDSAEPKYVVMHAYTK
jgi:hypothetical protein